MRKVDAVRHFGSGRKLAKALRITPGAVSQWKDAVPERAAYQIQVITGGILQVDPSMYRPRTLKPIETARSAV